MEALPLWWLRFHNMGFLESFQKRRVAPCSDNSWGHDPLPTHTNTHLHEGLQRSALCDTVTQSVSWYRFYWQPLEELPLVWWSVTFKCVSLSSHSNFPFLHPFSVLHRPLCSYEFPSHCFIPYLFPPTPSTLQSNLLLICDAIWIKYRAQPDRRCMNPQKNNLCIDPNAPNRKEQNKMIPSMKRGKMTKG